MANLVPCCWLFGHSCSVLLFRRGSWITFLTQVCYLLCAFDHIHMYFAQYKCSIIIIISSSFVLFLCRVFPPFLKVLRFSCLVYLRSSICSSPVFGVVLFPIVLFRTSGFLWSTFVDYRFHVSLYYFLGTWVTSFFLFCHHFSNSNGYATFHAACPSVVFLFYFINIFSLSFQLYFITDLFHQSR